MSSAFATFRTVRFRMRLRTGMCAASLLLATASTVASAHGQVSLQDQVSVKDQASIQSPASLGALASARAKGNAAISQLQQQLQKELLAALQQGGHVAAIAVCKQRAPQLAAEIGAQQGVTLRRTSERLRNPANSPDPDELKVLQQFAAAAATSAESGPQQVEQQVDVAGQPTLHLMRAIVVQAPCLGCHGSSLDASVQAAITQQYPTDHATGFQAGDLRGAFSVRVPIPAAVTSH